MDADGQAVEIVGLGLCFEDYPVGRRFATIGRSVTEADITNFVSVTGMTEVLFTNLDYLEKESLIGNRPAPGALVYCFAEGLLIQSVMQHTGLAFLGMDMKVERPVIAGDTIHVEVEVTAGSIVSSDVLDSTPLVRVSSSNANEFAKIDGAGGAAALPSQSPTSGAQPAPAGPKRTV